MQELWSKVIHGKSADALCQLSQLWKHDKAYEDVRYSGYGDEDFWQKTLVQEGSITFDNNLQLTNDYVFNPDKYANDEDYAEEIDTMTICIGHYCEIYEYIRYKLQMDPGHMHIDKNMHELYYKNL